MTPCLFDIHVVNTLNQRHTHHWHKPTRDFIFQCIRPQAMMTSIFLITITILYSVLGCGGCATGDDSEWAPNTLPWLPRPVDYQQAQKKQPLRRCLQQLCERMERLDFQEGPNILFLSMECDNATYTRMAHNLKQLGWDASVTTAQVVDDHSYNGYYVGRRPCLVRGTWQQFDVWSTECPVSVPVLIINLNPMVASPAPT